MISACVLPIVKHGGGGVMVWGGFAGNNACDLSRIQGPLNQHGYHSILQRYVIPSGLGVVFQQDNDPKHTSRLGRGYLTKESDGVLHQMTWSPQSPDLNPIEIIWEDLDPSSQQVLSICGNLKYKIDLDLFNTFLVTT